MGKLLTEWATGQPEAEFGLPVTPARPIPFHRFHRFHRAGPGATMAVFGLLDKLGR